MTRRTYQQAQTWRAAAVALLAEVGVEISPNPDSGKKTPHDMATGEQKIISGRGQIVTYLSGKVSIGGPGPEADYLCEPLERHGLLNGWHVGSRGSGVVWVPQREGAPLTVAEGSRRPLALAQAVRGLLLPDDEPSVDMTIGDVRLSVRRLRHAATPVWLATAWTSHRCYTEGEGNTACSALDNLIAATQRRLTAESGSGRVKP
jgi:hypothetical protein